jgi:riboflavin synthase
MFTGLVQSVGTIADIAPDGQGGQRLRIADAMAASVALGESIAVNGCCLTVVSQDRDTMSFDLGPETLARTTFGSLASGSRVNLERAVAVGERFGGHFVTGHIDAVGTIAAVELNGDWKTLRIEIPGAYDELLIEKGSIAVDGVSLTLATVEPGRVSIMIIPHTQSATTLGEKRQGDPVNLELDLIAKHVKKLFATLSLEI